MSFCSLIKGIIPKIRTLFCPNESVILNLLCVWITFVYLPFPAPGIGAAAACPEDGPALRPVPGEVRRPGPLRSVAAGHDRAGRDASEGAGARPDGGPEEDPGTDGGEGHSGTERAASGG